MDDSASVMMVAYYFPPMGGAGVQRTLKFAKYLLEYGWRPVVLTVNKGSDIQDQSLLAEIPRQIPIKRSSIIQLPPNLPWRMHSFINRWLCTVDEQIGWLPFGISMGKKILSGDKSIRAIYSSSSPYTSHLIARQLRLHSKLPWVADFRDPWVGNPFIYYPTRLHRNINEKLEKSVFTQADRVILNTVEAQRYYQQKYPDLLENKFTTIPNGYDAEDIPRENPKEHAVFTIAHLGSLYRKSRTSFFFLSALRKILNDGKVPGEKLHVSFIGKIDKETSFMIKEYGLDRVVELQGYRAHRQSLASLMAADILLLIPSSGPAADLFIPAKLYEYLACHKPILCLADTGGCADLVLKAHSGFVVPPTDIDAIADKIVWLFQKWVEGSLVIRPDVDLISTFERRKLTAQLANVLDEVTSNE